MENDAENKKEEKGIAAFAINNPHFTVVACLIATLMGTLSLVLLPKDLLPPANLPAVQILSFYPGMPVDHVEQDLTYLYERYTGQAVGIENQTSRSLMGVSVVKNFFNSSIDLSNAIAQTGSLVMSVLRKLPPGTQPPLILPFDPMAAVPLAMCAVGGDTKGEKELQDLARFYVINSIQSVPGAMAPAVMGGKTRQVIVYLDENKLKTFNFSPVQVMNKLDMMNTFIPTGDIKVGKYDYQITSNGLVANIDDMNNFLLRAQNGTPVPLKDVGRAEDSSAIQTNVVRIDGKPQVYVPIYRQPGANSLQVVDEVRKAVKKLEATQPGYKLDIVGDQSIFIRKAIESISHEALIGGGFAAIMVLLFLGSFRATIAVMLSLPLSLVGAFACLKMMGQSLNVMTLGGLALSVGVLVDNAIVVIEVIMQKRALGMSPREASLRGASEVAMPVLVSTVATLIVFFPVVFLKGVVKILFASLSIAVISSMAASYFAAMTVIPLYTTHFLKDGGVASKGFLGWIQKGVDNVTKNYGRSLGWVVSRRLVILPASLLILLLTGGFLIGGIGSELFPRADAGSFRIDFRGPTGYRIEETTAIASRIEQKLREWIGPHDLKMIITNAGVYYGYSAAFTPNSGTQDATFNVELTENREHSSQYYAKIIRERLPKEIPGSDFGIELGGLLTSALNGGLVSPIDLQIGGPNHEKTAEFAETLLPEIRKIPGAVDVRIQQKFDAPQMNLNINRQKAMELGLTPEDIVKNVVSGVSNSATYKPSIWIDPKTGIDYLFGVQFEEKSMTSFANLLSIPVTNPQQNRSVPLRWLADTNETKGPVELNHVNLQPVIDIYLDAQGRDIAGVAKDVDKVLASHKLPTGFWTEIRGEIASMKEAVGSLGGGFLLAAVLVYLIMVVQFRSFLLPAIIMTTVPMGMVGVIIIMSLWKTYFSIQAAIGCIFVIGVAVSHGVLLVEYILECSKHEPDVDKAIVTGAMARLRPITMTSLASILGLLPMAFGMGQGAEANIPLGRAVIGGQILSTLLNFYLVPCLFRALYGFIRKPVENGIVKNQNHSGEVAPA
jgi:multidrug efflux pump subunit AcrB